MSTPDQLTDLEERANVDMSPAARRQRRLAALEAAQGLWKNRKDIPTDGVEYQEQLRAEWH